MPRTYPPSSPQSSRTNAPRKYRQTTKGLTSQQGKAHTGARTPSPQDSTAPYVIPDDPGQLIREDDSPPYPELPSFTSKQVMLLRAYIGHTANPSLGLTGDPIKDALYLCQSVGYHPLNLHMAQTLLSYVLDRLTAVEDTRRMLRMVGMGEGAWIRRVFLISQCGSPRVEVQAAKLWGLALGAFDDPSPAAGARIVIEQAESAPDGRRTATRTTIEGASEVAVNGQQTLTIPIAKTNRRRKLLKSMEA